MPIWRIAPLKAEERGRPVLRQRCSAALCAGLAVVSMQAACGIAGDGRHAYGPASPPSSRVLARDFTARDVDGNRLRLSDYLREKTILLNFFTTWCMPCLVELPHLRKLYEANKGRGFIVIAISLDGPETVANVANFARRNDLPFPTVVDTDARIASIYNPERSLPRTVLIDREGNIVRVRDGYNAEDEKIVADDVANVLRGVTETGSPR